MQIIIYLSGICLSKEIHNNEATQPEVAINSMTGKSMKLACALCMYNEQLSGKSPDSGDINEN